MTVDELLGYISCHREYVSHYCEENVYKLAQKLLSFRGSITTALLDRQQSSVHSNAEALVDVLPFVVFISNERKQVPIWQQKLGEVFDGEECPVVWDYHVVLVVRCLLKRCHNHTDDANRSRISHAVKGIQTIGDSYPGIQSADSGRDTANIQYNDTHTTTFTHAEDVLIFDYDTKLDFPVAAATYIKYSFHPHERLRDEYEQMFRVVPAEDFVALFASDRSHMIGSGIAPPQWGLIRGPCAPCAMNLSTFIDMQHSSGDGQAEPQLQQSTCSVVSGKQQLSSVGKTFMGGNNNVDKSSNVQEIDHMGSMCSNSCSSNGGDNSNSYNAGGTGSIFNYSAERSNGTGNASSLVARVYSYGTVYTLDEFMQWTHGLD